MRDSMVVLAQAVDDGGAFAPCCGSDAAEHHPPCGRTGAGACAHTSYSLPAWARPGIRCTSLAPTRAPCANCAAPWTPGTRRWRSAAQDEGAGFDRMELLAWRTLGDGLLLHRHVRAGRTGAQRTAAASERNPGTACGRGAAGLVAPRRADDEHKQLCYIVRMHMPRAFLLLVLVLGPWRMRGKRAST